MEEVTAGANGEGWGVVHEGLRNGAVSGHLCTVAQCASVLGEQRRVEDLRAGVVGVAIVQAIQEGCADGSRSPAAASTCPGHRATQRE
eukprot:4627942-Lingulodinium_polyedra.AAC.1